MTFVDYFMDLLDESRKAISSESKAIDNHGDELVKLVDEALNGIELHVEKDPSITIISSSDPINGDYVNFGIHKSNC